LKKNWKKTRLKTYKMYSVIMGDDNEEIMGLIQGRLQLGRERYGHGVSVDDDTRRFGTESDNWELMLLEEVLDAQIYCAAAMIRIMRSKKNGLNNYTTNELFNSVVKNHYLTYSPSKRLFHSKF